MSATDVRTPRAMRVKRSDGAALFALGIPFVLLARHFWWVCDDAFISFRYASNWAAGHGLRYNLGEHSPVEGFSNFLWIVPTALIELLGADPTLWMPAISILCGVALLALVYRFLVLRLQVERSVSFLATLTLGFVSSFRRLGDEWSRNDGVRAHRLPPLRPVDRERERPARGVRRRRACALPIENRGHRLGARSGRTCVCFSRRPPSCDSSTTGDRFGHFFRLFRVALRILWATVPASRPVPKLGPFEIGHKSAA